MNTSHSLERAELIRRLFDEVVELDSQACAARLDQACQEDPTLRRDVEALLHANTHADDILRRLDHPASRLSAAAHWDKLSALFHEAAARPPEQRAAFLDEVCQGHTALREELESLLVYDEDASAFFEVLFQVVPMSLRARRQSPEPTLILLV